MQTPIFITGKKYPLRTQTTKVTRRATKPNSFTGEPEELEFTGQELAILIEGEDGEEYCFMDGKLLKAKNTTLDNCKKVRASASRYVAKPGPGDVIDFTTEQLVRHFVIPEVPDVASVNPEGFKKYVNEIHQIEAALAEA